MRSDLTDPKNISISPQRPSSRVRARHSPQFPTPQCVQYCSPETLHQEPMRIPGISPEHISNVTNVALKSCSELVTASPILKSEFVVSLLHWFAVLVQRDGYSEITVWVLLVATVTPRTPARPKGSALMTKICTEETGTVPEQSLTLLPATVPRPMNPALVVDFRPKVCVEQRVSKHTQAGVHTSW
jgi:hypothetical protein